MSAETKLALAFLTLWVLGMLLIAVGLWHHYRIAAGFCGLLLSIGGLVGFAAVVKGRS